LCACARLIHVTTDSRFTRSVTIFSLKSGRLVIYDLGGICLIIHTTASVVKMNPRTGDVYFSNKKKGTIGLKPLQRFVNGGKKETNIVGR